MTVTGYCNACEKQVLLSNDEQATAMVVCIPCEDEKGNEYEIKLFRCPHCESVQTVQIDNEKTNKLFVQSLKLLKQANATKDTKRKQRLKELFVKNDKKLNNARLELSIEADGKKFVNCFGEELIYKAPINSGAISD